MELGHGNKVLILIRDWRQSLSCNLVIGEHLLVSGVGEPGLPEWWTGHRKVILKLEIYFGISWNWYTGNIQIGGYIVLNNQVFDGKSG